MLTNIFIDIEYYESKEHSTKEENQDFTVVCKKKIVHTFRNKNLPFKVIEINKQAQTIKVDINDEKLDRVIGTQKTAK